MLDLKYYVLIDAVDRHGSLQAAAAAIGLTQPAATHRVREMERRLSIRVFEKRARRLELTTAGQRLLEAARQIMPLIQTAEREAHSLARTADSALRWGVAGYDVINAVLTRGFQSSMTDFQIDRIPSGGLAQALLDDQIDMALMTDPPVQSGIGNLQLFEDELVAIVPASHPIAVKESAAPEDLARDRYLTYTRGREAGFEFDRFFYPRGLAPVNIRVVDSVTAILELIAGTQSMVTILSSWVIAAASDSVRSGLAIRPLKDTRIIRPWYLSYVKNQLIDKEFSAIQDVLSLIKPLAANRA